MPQNHIGGLTLTLKSESNQIERQISKWYQDQR